MMVEQHDEFTCRVLAESPYSPLRSILEALTCVALVVAYAVQYRHTIKSTPDERNALPRSYVVFAALFALFQLCDYFVDDKYGVGFEARCPGALMGRHFWETTGGVWMLGVQMAGSLGLCVVYTVRSRREGKERGDDEEEGVHDGQDEPSPVTEAEVRVTEETPLLPHTTLDEETSSPSQPEPVSSSSSGGDLSYPAILILSTITTFLLLLLLILSPPNIDLGILLLALGISTTLTLLIVPFLAIPPKHTYAINAFLTIHLILITLWLSALYASTFSWPDAGWNGLEASLTIGFLRLSTLLFSSVFLVLQFVGLLNHLRLGKDTGLCLPSVVTLVLAQALMLGVLIQRAERRWSVERMWCELSGWDPGWWAGCEVEGGHVWGDGRFWMVSAQGRGAYGVLIMVLVAGVMVWRIVGERESVDEEQEEEERAE